MKTKLLASVLGIFAIGLASAQIFGFPDVTTNQWFYPYVMEIKDWGIVEGNDDGTFTPSRDINRAEFSKMIVRYDERVDSKITEAIKNISTPTAETETEQPVEVASLALPTIMHFDRRSDVGATSECPTGWTQVALGRIFENDKNISRRTCLTSQSCTTLTLRDRDKEPADCPRDWTEADFGYANEKERQRVCFICPQ